MPRYDWTKKWETGTVVKEEQNVCQQEQEIFKLNNQLSKKAVMYRHVYTLYQPNTS